MQTLEKGEDSRENIHLEVKCEPTYENEEIVDVLDVKKIYHPIFISNIIKDVNR